MQSKLGQILPRVEKPARYIGKEINSIKKPWDQVSLRFAFCFPDTYEIAMSHMGMKIIYHIINNLPWALCERAFIPWVDMIEEMKKANIPLFSLESQTPLSEFDVLGFTLQYEMSYTNILEMLHLGNVPIFSKNRDDKNPIIIAGGPCAYNPEPLADFIDAFLIGDGEKGTVEILDIIDKGKKAGKSRAQILKDLSKIQGVYVPELYSTSYEKDGTIASFSPKEKDTKPLVERRLEPELLPEDFPDKIIVPYVGIIHDRIMLEIMRGCTKGCRFCQAGMLYRPVREKSVKELTAIAEKLVNATGYEEISLSSLSSGDYSHLDELMESLNKTFEGKGVSLSLPSLRVDKSLEETLTLSQKVRKSGLTFAPEAGSQRLRDVINKGVTEKDLMDRAKEAFEKGWSTIKLYFMIGLPTETEEDIKSIADLVRGVTDIYSQSKKQGRQKYLKLNVGASGFVPKPFTPFQWEGQDSLESFQTKQSLLRRLLKIRGVTFSWHEAKVSFLEACFSRGDRRLGKVLYRAWSLGCIFDGWYEKFDFDLWMQAFKEEGIEPEFYANRIREKEEILPWDFIDAGVTKDFLWRERDRAMKELITIDCREGCIRCGIERWKGACENAYDADI